MTKHSSFKIILLIGFNLLLAVVIILFHKPILLTLRQLVFLPVFVYYSLFGSTEDYGYIDKSGHFVEVLKFQKSRRFVLDSRFVHGLVCSSSYGKPSYLSLSGKFSPVPFAKIGRFDESSLAPVFDLKSWGYINTSQKLAIPCRYSEVSHFSSGLAAARQALSSGASLYGYIDTAGSWKISPKFERAGSFSEGLAPVKLGGFWGFIRQDGIFKIAPAFQYASEFHNARALVSKDKLAGAKANYICIDSDGRSVFRFTFDDSLVPKPFSISGPIPNSFDSDYRELKANCLDYSEGLLVRQYGHKYGYCDVNGNTVISANFDFAFPFSNGRAVVYRNTDGAGKYAFIDKAGNLITDFKFDYATAYSESLACVYIKEKGYHYLDLAGNQAFADTFELAYPFYEGKALVIKLPN